MPCPPCSRRQPSRADRGEGSEPHRRRRRRRVRGTGREEGDSRGPSGFYPRRAPLLFITMAGAGGHRSTPPASSPPRVASRAPPPPWPCLPVCLPLVASASRPLFFARFLTAPCSFSGLAPAGRLSPPLSPFASSTEPAAIGKLASGVGRIREWFAGKREDWASMTAGFEIAA